MKSWIARVIIFIFLCWGGAFSVANAHPMPQSSLEVIVYPKSWRLKLFLPSDRLAVALVQAGQISNPEPNGNASKSLTSELVRRYVEERIKASSDDGTVWALRVAETRPPSLEQNDWVVDVELTPPAGKAPMALNLEYEVIVKEIATHSVIVSLEADWFKGLQPQAPRIIATLGGQVHKIRVDRSAGSRFAGIFDVFTMGIQHIAEGTDHLLFLLALILPSPLLAQGGRWGGYVGVKPSFIKLLRVVSAFTIGHSLTLMLGSFAVFTVPQKAVEVLVAFSILVSAAHAWRPLFRGQEAWIAGVFGLVHGMAFSTAIASIGLDVIQKTAAIVTFNLGIEVMQLFIISLIAPCFILLAKTGSYRSFRLAGAALAAVASVVWVVERLMEKPNATSSAIDSVFSLAPLWLATLTIGSGFAFWRYKVRIKSENRSC